MKDLNIVKRNINELKAYKNNPRINKNAIPKVAESIKKYGYKVPIVIDKDNEIICGHTRFEALKSLQVEEINCLLADDLTPEQVREFRIIDNKTQEYAEWDFPKLELELQDLKLDFKDLEVHTFIKTEKKEDYKEKELKDTQKVETLRATTTTTTRGDVWKLGKHRLMCGDSLNYEDVKKLLDGKKPNLFILDPPYGMKKKDVKNDRLLPYDLQKFLTNLMNNLLKFSEESASFFLYNNFQALAMFYTNYIEMKEKDGALTFRNFITWNKQSGQNANSYHARSFSNWCEYLLFFVQGNQGFFKFENKEKSNFYDGWLPILEYLQEEKKKSGLTPVFWEKTLIKNYAYGHYFTKTQFELIPEEHYKKLQEHYKGHFLKPWGSLKLQYMEIEKERKKKQPYFNSMFYGNGGNVFEHVYACLTDYKEEKVQKNIYHETPKPYEQIKILIGTTTDLFNYNIVFDPFGGSGTTLLACEEMKRQAYIMELDPLHCQTIINRWEKKTGKKAERING